VEHGQQAGAVKTDQQGVNQGARATPKRRDQQDHIDHPELGPKQGGSGWVLPRKRNQPLPASNSEPHRASRGQGWNEVDFPAVEHGPPLRLWGLAQLDGLPKGLASSASASSGSAGSCDRQGFACPQENGNLQQPCRQGAADRIAARCCVVSGARA